MFLAASVLAACLYVQPQVWDEARDRDNDGHVDAAFADGDDCDDAAATVHPGSGETCNGIDDDCDGTIDEPDALGATTWYADVDGDGFGNATAKQVACQAPSGFVAGLADGVAYDCDDGSPGVHPGADETCNDVDDDCDGATDEDVADAPSWYADADGDGYGNPGDALAGCDASEGRIADGTDCDDASAAISPASVEVCNLVDDDCDGTMDEADAADALTWYADTDEDGYGNLLVSTTACWAPGGYSDLATDCDDESAAVHPLAAEQCNAVDDDCDGTTDEPEAVGAPTWYADADADGFGNPGSTAVACAAPEGYLADDTDCDDARPAVFPGAPEACNGLDDDCDGTTDEPDAVDSSTWYADKDGDGFGDAASAVLACEAPAAHVAGASDGVAFDCDDHEDDTWPGAPETCDGVDDDCDGATDEPDAIDAPTWYADVDRDGYGDPSATTVGCAAPEGYLALATDCDDASAATHPGAEEVCNRVDDDCDGEVDGPEIADAPRVYQDADGDGYGDPDVETAACETLTGYVEDATDCDDSSAEVHPGASERCSDHVDANCDPTDCAFEAEVGLGEADARYTETVYGFNTTGALGGGGDFNGDGYDDMAFGASLTNCSGYYSYEERGGGIRLVLGSSHPYGSALSYADADYYGGFLDYAGSAVAFAGDTDGDGLDDILVGGYIHDRVYLLPGTTSPETASLSSMGVTLIGEYGTYAGDSVSGAGDVNGDGLDDLLIGAPHRVESGLWTGAAYVVLGQPTPTDLSLPYADAVLIQEGSDQEAGSAVAGAGDVDGDGLDDILIGAPSADDYAGRVYMLLGQEDVTSLSLYEPEAILSGDDDYAGGAVAGAGDVNGDGHADLLVGASSNDAVGDGSGAAYLVLGHAALGDLDLADAEARFTGESSGDDAGTSVSGAGDVDADGFADLLIGSDAGGYGSSNPGAAWLVLGSPTPAGGSLSEADAHFTGEADADGAGRVVSGAGDVDADGYADFLVSAPSLPAVSTYTLWSGAAYLILGFGQ